MPGKHYLSGATLILADEVITDGSVLIEDGVISAINPVNADFTKEISLKGKTLMPGMIDLHCDALEKEVEPRPNVHFPLDFACAQADKRNAAAGITTVYHALSFANDELGVRNNEFAARIVHAVNDWQPHALVDNRVHCRYEITDASGLPILLDLLAQDAMHLVSLMDHTPGQGQFKDMAAYRTYLTRTYKKTDQELDEIIANKIAAASGAYDRIETLVHAAQQHGVAVASHDDDNLERVETIARLGISLSEFPINLETARAAHDKNIKTIFGAPNILRGGSQSGSMRAVDAVHAGVADCLCADYSPATLIVAIFKLAQEYDVPLVDAIRLVTLNPARAVGLQDRGEVVVGKRADLIAVSHFGRLPQVADVWVHGAHAYRAVYDHD